MSDATSTALITGAAGGIGEAIARRLAGDGSHVVLLDRNPRELDRVAIDLEREGHNVETHEVDLTDHEEISRVIPAVLQGAGVDILVNNAGVGVAANLPETTREDWHRVFAVNTHAIFEISRLVIPHMRVRGGGVIVNVASVAGLVGLRSRAAYCASKGALIALTRAMAVDHATDNIRVNAVCPGTIETGWIEAILSGQADKPTARKTMEQRQLLGRLGTPEEIADAVAFLVENRFATGSALVIDGGMTAT